MESGPLRTFDDLIKKFETSLGKHNADSIIALFTHIAKTASLQGEGSSEVNFANARNAGLVANRFSSIIKNQSKFNVNASAITFEGGQFDLGGAASPLPAQLFDDILKDSKAGNQLALEFLDIFVDRLTKLDFIMRNALSVDLNPFAFEDNPALQIINEMATIKEDFFSMPLLSHPLNFEILKTFAFHKPISAHVTKLILQKVFACPVTIKQYCIRYIKIPEKIQMRLSTAAEANLGKGSILGRYSPNAASGVEIFVKDLHGADVDILAVNQAFLANLKVLFRAIFTSPMTITLTLLRRSGKGLVLGDNAVLGRNSWVNSNNDHYQPVSIKFNSWENQSA